MKKIKTIAIIVTLALFSQLIYAGTHSLPDDRIQVVRSYLQALNNKNLAQMLSLLDQDAILHTDSAGIVSPSDFFPKLFAKMQSSSVHLHGINLNLPLNERITAEFEFKWIDVDHHMHGGSFKNIFIFKSDHLTLHEVDMIAL